MCFPLAPFATKLLEFEHLGYECLVTTNGGGVRCGYLRVPVGHPWHGKDYDDIDANCHGSLTFADADEPCDKAGEDNAWWVGFDCGQALTDLPDPELIIADGREFIKESLLFMEQRRMMYPGPYYLPKREVRSTDYVADQLRSLAEQASHA